MTEEKEDIEISPEFWAKAQDIVEKLIENKENKGYLVVSHHDADGVSSCAIMVDFLKSRGKEVDFMTIKQLDSITFKKIKKTCEDYKNRIIVFTDMGSGQLSLIEKEGITDYYIFDHHVPERNKKEDEGNRQLNPSFYGYDGGIDISGAGVTYIAARAKRHKKMAHIAIVGALGDMQDNKGKLHSLNRIILKDAIEEKSMIIENDLRLFGRQSRSLVHMLAYASEPILPGLSGSEKNCIFFLESLGIKTRNDINSNGKDAWINYIDLDIKERTKLISALYVLLLDKGIPEFVIQGIVGEVYTLTKEKVRTELRDGKEFATVLNACGRQNRPELGVYVCLGDRGGIWNEAKSLLQIHRKMLRDGIDYLKETGVSEKKNLYYFNASGHIEENLVGVIAGMGYGARIISPDKPILALAEDNDDKNMLKVSSRANWGLIKKGIHLGNAMREGSKKFGGEGGGHDIAAGARIPKDKIEEFLDEINDIFGEQLNVRENEKKEEV